MAVEKDPNWIGFIFNDKDPYKILIKLWKDQQYVFMIYLTLRAVLSNEAHVTDTHTILTVSLVVAISWAGQYGTVRSSESLVTHTVAIDAVTSV